jgi:hypothetical protein
MYGIFTHLLSHCIQVQNDYSNVSVLNVSQFYVIFFLKKSIIFLKRDFVCGVTQNQKMS